MISTLAAVIPLDVEFLSLNVKLWLVPIEYLVPTLADVIRATLFLRVVFTESHLLSKHQSTFDQSTSRIQADHQANVMILQCGLEEAMFGLITPMRST